MDWIGLGYPIPLWHQEHRSRAMLIMRGNILKLITYLIIWCIYQNMMLLHSKTFRRLDKSCRVGGFVPFMYSWYFQQIPSCLRFQLNHLSTSRANARGICINFSFPPSLSCEIRQIKLPPFTTSDTISNWYVKKMIHNVNIPRGTTDLGLTPLLESSYFLKF